MGEEAVRKAKQYVLRAYRKMGEMLKETPRAEAGRPQKIGYML